jgi:hypothetical protein
MTEKMVRKQLGERLNADMSDKRELIRKHVSGGGSGGPGGGWLGKYLKQSST